jgi:drug/metabolite transporter (DMT)-like permease
VTIVYALSSSLVWGCADFLGGLFSRRLPLAAVTLISQAAGLVALLVWLTGSGFHVGGTAFALGAVGGIGGAIGLSAFYKGLAIGTMSIVSPVAACGALVPFGIALATGERPAAAAIGGAVIALVGAVLASLDERRAEGERRRGAVLAVVAAVAIGLFIYFLGLASKHGTALSVLLGARVGSLSLLLAGSVLLHMQRRVERRDVPGVTAVGLLDTGANGLFVLASAGGFLSLVSVLGSLYPVVTLLAARVGRGTDQPAAAVRRGARARRGRDRGGGGLSRPVTM